MSFNDLKPIYKEFLLKLAVTLTKDELYQRSKSIMRRQKKKLLRRKKSTASSYPVSNTGDYNCISQRLTDLLLVWFQYTRKSLFLGSNGLKRVFRFSKHFFQNKSKAKTGLDGLTKKAKKLNRIKALTSGSDLSETQNELTLNAQNRNSSSG